MIHQFSYSVILLELLRAEWWKGFLFHRDACFEFEANVYRFDVDCLTGDTFLRRLLQEL